MFLKTVISPLFCSKLSGVWSTHYHGQMNKHLYRTELYALQYMHCVGNVQAETELIKSCFTKKLRDDTDLYLPVVLNTCLPRR